MRKCRMCPAPLPPASKCTTAIGKRKLCSIDCAVEYGMKEAARQREKAHKQRSAESRAKVRERNENDTGHQQELTQRECNRLIRLLDQGKTCPTCDKPLIDGQYDAGHVRTRAACPELALDTRAIFGQCRSCNGSGTLRKRTRKTQESVSDAYKQWILREKGQEYHDWLYGPHELKRYTIDQLKAMRKEFAAESRRLEKGLSQTRDWRANTIANRKEVC